MADALTDSLVRNDPKSQELAYNNTTDRLKVELPAPGDPSASGCVSFKEVGPIDQPLTKKRFFYNGDGDISEIKIANAADPSGAVCRVQTFTYNGAFDVDYIVESLGSW